MSQQTITIGNAANDESGDPLRTAFAKVNDNFTELFAYTGLRRYLTGSKTWTPGSIADGAMATTQVTVTNALVGSTALASVATSLAGGAILSAHVYSAGIVQVTLFNKSGGALDIGSATLKVDVLY